MGQFRPKKNSSDATNKKKRNLLWQIDFLEAQLKQNVDNTRLKSTKAAADRELKRQRYKQRSLKAAAAAKDQEADSNDATKSALIEEEISAKNSERKAELQTQINALKKQLVEQKVHHGIVQVQRALKKSRTMDLLKTRKALNRIRKKEDENGEGSEKSKEELEKKLSNLKAVDIAELSKEIVNRNIYTTYMKATVTSDSEGVDADDTSSSESSKETQLPEWIPETVRPSDSISLDEEQYQHFSKLKSVTEQLEELTGIINFAVGVGEKVRKGQANDLHNDANEDDTEKRGGSSGDSASDDEAAADANIDDIEYHGRPLAFSEDEDEDESRSIDIDDIEKLKKDKKIVVNTSTLNYDDISDSEDDNTAYNNISDDESDEDSDQEISENDDDDEEAEEEGGFFEDLDEGPATTEEISTKPKKRKVRENDEDDGKDEKKDKKSKKEKKKVVLPALLNTFIGASDEEEAAELQRELNEMDVIDGVDPTTRKKKNRMGQRERRSLAERKFGQGANHLKTERDKYRVKRAKLQEEYEAREAKRQKAGITKSASAAKKEAIKQAEKKRLESLPLHPSWEAKKKLAAAASAPIKFSGKKVVFD